MVDRTLRGKCASFVKKCRQVFYAADDQCNDHYAFAHITDAQFEELCTHMTTTLAPSTFFVVQTYHSTSLATHVGPNATYFEMGGNGRWRESEPYTYSWNRKKSRVPWW